MRTGDAHPAANSFLPSITKNSPTRYEAQLLQQWLSWKQEPKQQHEIISCYFKRYVSYLFPIGLQVSNNIIEKKLMWNLLSLHTCINLPSRTQNALTYLAECDFVWQAVLDPGMLTKKNEGKSHVQFCLEADPEEAWSPLPGLGSEQKTCTKNTMKIHHLLWYVSFGLQPWARPRPPDAWGCMLSADPLS